MPIDKNTNNIGNLEKALTKKYLEISYFDQKGLVKIYGYVQSMDVCKKTSTMNFHVERPVNGKNGKFLECLPLGVHYSIQYFTKEEFNKYYNDKDDIKKESIGFNYKNKNKVL